MTTAMYEWRVRTVPANELEEELNAGLCEEAKRRSKAKDSYNIAHAFDLYAILPVPGSEQMFTVVARREITYR